MTALLTQLIEEAGASNDTKLLDAICFNIDVKKRLYSEYIDSSLARGVEGNELDSNAYMAVVEFLTSCVENQKDIKALNSLLKVRDGILRETKFSVLPDRVITVINKFIDDIKIPECIGGPSYLDLLDEAHEIAQRKTSKLKDAKLLDVIFLAWDGPVARAYLQTLSACGYVPKEIVVVKNRIPLKLRIRNILPDSVYRFIKRRLLMDSSELAPKTETPKSDISLFSETVPPLSTSPFPYHKYGKVVKTCVAQNVNDDAVVSKLSALSGDTIIFSGGGIVRQQTFDALNKKIIHIHPGDLPSVRGADGFCWSLLLSGVLSVSAMNLNAGIDTGDIIGKEYFSVPRVNNKRIRSYPAHLGSMIVYRTIINELDPWMRATLLKRLLVASDGDFGNLLGGEMTKQEIADGRQYHFMHADIRNKVSNLLIEYL